MIPNVVGLLLGIVQIVIFMIFKRKYPTLSDRERDTSTIDIENNSMDDKKEYSKGDEENNNTKEKPVKILATKIDS